MENTIGSPSKNTMKIFGGTTMATQNTIFVSNLVEANIASTALYDLWVKSAREVIAGISRDHISQKKLGQYWTKFQSLRYISDAERAGVLGVVIAMCDGAVKEAAADAVRTYVLQQSLQTAVNSGDLQVANQILALM